LDYDDDGTNQSNQEAAAGDDALVDADDEGNGDADDDIFDAIEQALSAVPSPSQHTSPAGGAAAMNSPPHQEYDYEAYTHHTYDPNAIQEEGEDVDAEGEPVMMSEQYQQDDGSGGGMYVPFSSDPAAFPTYGGPSWLPHGTPGPELLHTTPSVGSHSPSRALLSSPSHAGGNSSPGSIVAPRSVSSRHVMSKYIAADKYAYENLDNKDFLSTSWVPPNKHRVRAPCCLTGVGFVTVSRFSSRRACLRVCARAWAPILA
jgi:hypothetical protein